MDYYLSILAFAGIYMIAVMGTFLLTGMTGMFSLGQAAMMACGAYVTGILTARLGWPPIPAILVALLFTALLAMFIGSFTLRMRPEFFALATFGFSEAINGVLTLATTFTGGATGLFGVPMVVQTPMIWVFLAVTIVIIAALTFSGFGRKCLAVRDDPLVADAMGVSVYKHRMKVFVIASVLAGLSGCLYVHYTSFIDPSMFNWMTSAEWMLLVFVGGRSNLVGTVITSGLLLGLPELLRAVNEWRTVLYGILVIILLNFRPDGLFGSYYSKVSKPSLYSKFLSLFKRGERGKSDARS